MRPLRRVALLVSCLVLAGCEEHAVHQATTGAASGPAVATASDSGPALRPTDAASLVALANDGRARVTVLNVWATWCMPCRQEFPELLEASRAHAGDGVRLVLVSTDFADEM